MPFLKEVTKNVHEYQYSHTSKLKKDKIILLTGFYQVVNIKSDTLFNSIKDALGQINNDEHIVKFNTMIGHPTWSVLRLE